MNEAQSQLWDAWWEKKLTDKYMGQFAFCPLQADFHIASARYFQAEGAKHVLLPGNGCSLVPYALAHLGLIVTVLDISKVALTALQQKGEALTEAALCRYLPVYREKKEYGMSVMERDPKASLIFVRELYRPGGEVHLVHTDLFEDDLEIATDFIVDDRLVMLYDAESQAKLARRYAQWLRPGGTCYVDTINYGVRHGDGGFDYSGVEVARKGLETAFEHAGFFEGHPYSQDFPHIVTKGIFRREKWVQRLTRTPEELAQQQRCASGEKLVAFCHGSG